MEQPISLEIIMKSIMQVCDKIIVCRVEPSTQTTIIFITTDNTKALLQQRNNPLVDIIEQYKGLIKLIGKHVIFESLIETYLDKFHIKKYYCVYRHKKSNFLRVHNNNHLVNCRYIDQFSTSQCGYFITDRPTDGYSVNFKIDYSRIRRMPESLIQYIKHIIVNTFGSKEEAMACFNSLKTLFHYEECCLVEKCKKINGIKESSESIIGQLARKI